MGKSGIRRHSPSFASAAKQSTLRCSDSDGLLVAALRAMTADERGYASAILIRRNLDQAAVGIPAIDRPQRAAGALFGDRAFLDRDAIAPSDAPPPRPACSRSESTDRRCRRFRWSAVNHSTLSASRGRTLIFWFPNISEVRGVLPGPGSNTLTSMPRIFRYHSAERATSATLITMMIERVNPDGHALSFRRGPGRSRRTGRIRVCLLQRGPRSVQ